MKATMKINVAAAMIGLTSALTCFAQGTQTGGGRAQELALEHMMLDLIPYLESSEGRKAFPEVAAYDKAHPREPFSSLLRNTAIVLVPGEVKDRFDADRDCISYFGDPKNRYIRCNQDVIPDATNAENQRLLYSFLFHEILVQAKLEKSRSENIPSDYHISKRMGFHKDASDKWIPGGTTPKPSKQPAVKLSDAKAFAESEVKRLEIEMGNAAVDPTLTPCDFYALEAQLEYNRWFLKSEHYQQFEQLEKDIDSSIAAINAKLAGLENATVNVLVYQGQSAQSSEVPIAFRDLVNFFKIYDQRIKNCPKDQRAALMNMMQEEAKATPVGVVLSQVVAAGGMMSVNMNASLREQATTYEILMKPREGGFSLDLVVSADLNGAKEKYQFSLLDSEAGVKQIKLDEKAKWEILGKGEIDGMPMDGLLRYRKIQDHYKEKCTSFPRISSHVYGTPYVKYSDLSKITKELDRQAHEAIQEMEFVTIKPGTFWMGNRSDESWQSRYEVPHQVTLTKGFEMQTTEVTQKQWFKVMKHKRSAHRNKENCPQTWKKHMCPNNPVEMVKWDEVQVFIQRLNDKNDGYLYRLPTEAEWEYAARAGTATSYFNGDSKESVKQVGWIKENSERSTHEVATAKAGEGAANAYGLFDMHGNVWEFVQDWYGDYTAQAQVDPMGPPRSDRDGFDNVKGHVVRGGSRASDPLDARSASRQWDNSYGNDVGFRLVRTIR